MLQGQCDKCSDLGDFHGVECIVRKLVFERDFKAKSKIHVTRKVAMESAVRAIENFYKHTKEEGTMKDQQVSLVKNETTSVSLAEKFGFTQSQLDLIRRTVAKDANDDELEIFFYRAQKLDANPLMPGEIYFVKFGNSPGTIITGIDTFRNQAHKTGLLAGVKRGVIRDKNGACIGAWADVYRSDWKEPAHEEVALKEYNTGKNLWAKMPETMIKKVAEVAAYRMAFPKQLGGLYSQEEMDQAKKKEREVESESDDAPKTIAPVQALPPEKPKQPSKAQMQRLYAIAHSHSITKEELKEIFMQKYQRLGITLDEYNDLCESIEGGEYDALPDLPSNKAEADFGAIEISDSNEDFEIVQNSENLGAAPKKDPPKVETELPWKKYLVQNNSDVRIVK